MNTTKLPEVDVLLATYKPTKFIKEQISSILAQEKVKINIYWSDFNSPEESKVTIRELLKNSNYREFSYNEPGASNNFFSLLSKSSAPYIAFADQDDIWLPRKLINQVNSIKDLNDEPTLVHANVDLLIDGEIVHRNSICNGHSFDDLAFTNCVQGCTLMLNSAARELILEKLPKNIVWHDWWIGLVLSLRGNVLVSNNIDTLYRIHQGNAIGLPSNMKRVVRFLLREPRIVRNQILTALNSYATKTQMDSKEVTFLLKLTSLSRSTRIKAALIDKKRRNSTFEDLVRRLLVIFKVP